jgi:hypothetical protein
MAKRYPVFSGYVTPFIHLVLAPYTYFFRNNRADVDRVPRAPWGPDAAQGLG